MTILYEDREPLAHELMLDDCPFLQPFMQQLDTLFSTNFKDMRSFFAELHIMQVDFMQMQHMCSVHCM